MRFPFHKQRLHKKLKRIRLVACDLDGTLLTDENEITTKSLESLRRLQESGISVMLLSGRTDAFIRTYASQIASPLPIVSLNGGLVIDGSREILFMSPIDSAVGQYLLDATSNHSGADFSAFTADGIVSRSDAPALPRYLRAKTKEFHRTEFLASYFDTTVLYVVSGPYSLLQQISLACVKITPPVDRILYPSKHSSDVYYLEIRNRSVNKGAALREILPTLGFTRSELAALGDYTNDLELCRYASISAAMRNAVEDLKLVADFVTVRTNNEDGAAEFFDMLYQRQHLS